MEVDADQDNAADMGKSFPQAEKDAHVLTCLFNPKIDNLAGEKRRVAGLEV